MMNAGCYVSVAGNSLGVGEAWTRGCCNTALCAEVHTDNLGVFIDTVS